MDYELLVEIRNCLDLENFVSQIIKLRVLEASEINERDCNFLGFYFDKVPSDKFSVNYSWHGFIDENVRVTYGIIKDRNHNITSDDGMYFYVDDYSYIYEFIEYIRDIDIKSEAQFVLLVFEFLNEYFERKDFNFGTSRTEMYRYLLDSKGNILKPTLKHSIKDFKHQGNAMCVERSVLAENLLDFFGFETALVYGTFSKGGMNDLVHAFNVVSFNNQDYIVDMNCMVRSYDINSYDNTFYPFTDTLTSEMFDKISLGEDIILNDYFMVLINNNHYYFNNGIERKYVFSKCKNIRLGD